MNRSDKISGVLTSREAVSEMMSADLFADKIIVFTNGCFDLLHDGHIHLLSKAKEQGDILIVGLNSDESVRRLKGNDRPVYGEEKRASMLVSLKMVDYVVLFSEDTPEQLIKTIKPDVLIKGGDYKEEDIVGAGFVKSYGGKVSVIPLLKGFSTTQIIDKSEKK